MSANLKKCWITPSKYKEEMTTLNLEMTTTDGENKVTVTEFLISKANSTRQAIAIQYLSIEDLQNLRQTINNYLEML